MNAVPFLYLAFFTILMLIIGRYMWVLWQRHRNYNENLQGDAEWENPKIAEGQYKKIPDRNQTYPGVGGVPIMHKTATTPRGKLLDFQMKHPKVTSHLVNRLIDYFDNSQLAQKFGKTTGHYYIDDDINMQHDQKMR